jgi:hypothetical protein
LPSGSFDIKTYDVGNLHVFSDGVAASTNLGLLEVKYVVDLFTPQIQNPAGGAFYGSVGTNATHLFGTDFLTNADADAIGVGSIDTTGQVFTFNQTWQGLIGINLVGTGLAANYAPVVANGSAAVISQRVDGTGTGVSILLRVRAIPGTSLTPTVTATTVTLAAYYFGGVVGYNQLGV